MTADVRARHLAIALGGAAGASVRWAVGTVLHHGPGVSWATFVVNVAGCALLGIVLAEEWTHPRARLLLHDFGGIGFCGGLTTMSTFAVEVVNALNDGRVAQAVVYLGSSVVFGGLAFVAAGVVLRRVRALALPLEELP